MDKQLPPITLEVKTYLEFSIAQNSLSAVYINTLKLFSQKYIKALDYIYGKRRCELVPPTALSIESTFNIADLLTWLTELMNVCQKKIGDRKLK